ncbi:MAG: helix-turn-helix domain-containing protein [Streptosporangiales bacterium]|nr:helix-turn-helix domain-containing protein [Streptosporangiales bacterium]
MTTRSWDEIRAELDVDEDAVAAERDRMLAEVRLHRLAELRNRQGLTQTDVAEQMGVSQRRVSQIERGQLSRSEIATIQSYVQALGGRLRVVADFGDERHVVG